MPQALKLSLWSLPVHAQTRAPTDAWGVVVAHAFNSSTWGQRQADLCEFKPSLIYRASCRTARATQRDPGRGGGAEPTPTYHIRNAHTDISHIALAQLPCCVQGSGSSTNTAANLKASSLCCQRSCRLNHGLCPLVAFVPLHSTDTRLLPQQKPSLRHKRQYILGHNNSPTQLF